VPDSRLCSSSLSWLLTSHFILFYRAILYSSSTVTDTMGADTGLADMTFGSVSLLVSDTRTSEKVIHSDIDGRDGR
jgi:hypothetical protein